MGVDREHETHASGGVAGMSGETVAGVARALADALAVLFSFAVSYHLYRWVRHTELLYRGQSQTGRYVAIAAVFSALCVLMFWQLGLYRRRVSVLNLWELETAIKGLVRAAAYFFALLFFLELKDFSRPIVVGAIVLSGIVIVLERRLLVALAGRLQLRGQHGRRIMIHGCGVTGRLLMKKIVQSPSMRYRVVGFLDDSAPIGSLVSCRVAQTGQLLFQAPVFGRWKDWQRVVDEQGVDELLVTAPGFDPDKLSELLRVARRRGLAVGVVPHLQDVRADQMHVEDLSAIPVLRPYSPSPRRLYSLVKRLIDVVGASVLLVVTAPLFAIAGLLVRLETGSSFLFVQERVGLSGRRFRMLKFRTMWPNASPYAPSPKGDVDPRITRIGRLLRVGGLDELPQLINVLRGEMSLVGPRPEMPFIVERYTPLERQRLQVKPGITGLWQLSADRHLEIHENIEYDLFYIHHRSLVMDLVILLETAFFTLGVAVGGLHRRTAEDRTPALPPQDARDGDQGYVLVALDQRGSGVTPVSWQTFVPAAYALADRWPVKMLVAGDNIAAFDELLAEPAHRQERQRYQMEYVSYAGRAGLRSLLSGARLVITDLPHVLAAAEELGVGVITVSEGRAHWTAGARDADEILDALWATLPSDTTTESGAAPHAFGRVGLGG